MKKFFVIAAMAIFLFAGCSSSDDTLNDNEQVTNPTSQTETVTISFSPYTIESMMAKTRATKDIGALASRLDVWIMEGDATTAPTQKPVSETHQQKSDDGFGTLSVKLNKDKTYTLYAIAHSESVPSTFSNGVVSFTDTKKLQVFAYTQTFSPATTTTLSCIMQRQVGLLQFTITDAIPTDVKKFGIAISNAPTQYSFTEQRGVNVGSDDYKVEWTNWQEFKKGSVALNMYVLGSSTQTLHNVTVTAYGADGGIIKQRVFTDVPVINNHKTIYRGSFFQDTPLAGTFQLNDDWTEDEVEY